MPLAHRTHWLFRGVFPLHGKFSLPQRNEWHCALRPGDTISSALGAHPVRTLASGANGFVSSAILECRNMVAVQGHADERHANSLL